MIDLSSILHTGGAEAGSRPAEGQSPSSKQLGQLEFFELMNAQLRHQDPLEPMQSETLMAQVAQFSTVDGIQEMQRSIETLVGSFQSAQALQASTLVGREVLINSERAMLKGGNEVAGAIRLDDSVKALSIEVLTPSGTLIRKLELGAQQSGQVDFTWDGRDSTGQPAAPGQYLVRAEAVREGATLAVPTLLKTKVESVSLNREPGTVTLNLRDHDPVLLDRLAQLL